MRIFKLLTLLFSVILASCASTSDTDLSAPGAQIILEDLDHSYALTVPQSKLVLAMPKLNFQPNKPAPNASPRYFMFYDEKHLLGLSGWFEHESRFTSRDELWQKFLDRWPGKPPTDVQFSQIGEWQVVKYKLEFAGQEQHNIKAHLVKNGTWLDIHISKLGDNPEQLLSQFLESLMIIDKNLKTSA